MSNDLFTSLETETAASGLPAALDRLAIHFTAEQRYHELFDLRLMQGRVRLGLPAVSNTSLDELPEQMREQVEQIYLAACSEVGQLLLAQGKLREAWHYLRPVGKKEPITAALKALEINDVNLEEIVDLSIGGQLDPVFGYKLVLENYGTCNAITTFDNQIARCPLSVQQEAAGLLVAAVHAELLATVQEDIKKRGNEQSPPTSKRDTGEASDTPATTLAGLIEQREWLFADANYHTDPSHINSAVRIARSIVDKTKLALVADMCAYGGKLAEQYQSSGELPFEDFYRTHRLFYAAQLGNDVETALAYFLERAETTDVYSQGSGAVEVYVALLARLGKNAEALAASMRWLPPGSRQSGFAPSLLELSTAAGDFNTLKDFCREHGDLLNYAAALAVENENKPVAGIRYALID